MKACVYYNAEKKTIDIRLDGDGNAAECALLDLLDDQKVVPTFVPRRNNSGYPYFQFSLELKCK